MPKTTRKNPAKVLLRKTGLGYMYNQFTNCFQFTPAVILAIKRNGAAPRKSKATPRGNMYEETIIKRTLFSTI